METLMDKLFEPRRNVVCVKPTRLGVVTDGVIAFEKPDLINLFEGISSEFAFIIIARTMSSKRKCVQTPIEEKVKKLKI
ncbi:hypothetical protein PPTG_07784 [Phytophthora nicotianae INRA-310]|uniref:Uncharacterized protein n=1 Tax=Phytophthora nicotianae (strain INRA-310) TaxID=761204 RepID=W2QPD7_PHYN3|nr:hypothetical protein PPTG_07784 [Phytophthora nicotianae INRA-310]ETN14125.1 hypothetical protein PPTG_07784 [Phytophthora nicotianae INRA-310]